MLKKTIEWHCLDDQLTLFLEIWRWSWTCFSLFESFPKPSEDQSDLETKTLNTSSPKRRKHFNYFNNLSGEFSHLLGNEKWRKQRKHQHATSQLIDGRHFQKVAKMLNVALCAHFIMTPLVQSSRNLHNCLLIKTIYHVCQQNIV